MTPTPGPWVFDPDNIGTDASPYYGIMTESLGQSIVCVPLRNPNAEADARLAAKAPELLEILKEVLDAADAVLTTEPSSRPRPLYQRAHAIVAEVEGCEPHHT